MTDWRVVLRRLDELAASLPPGAVLAHVVTQSPKGRMKLTDRVARMHAWAKIGDGPWRSVSHVRIAQCEGWTQPDGSALLITWRSWLGDWALFPIVTPSVTWEQSYGLRGRHEVMGVVG